MRVNRSFRGTPCQESAIRFAPVRRPGQDDDHGVIGITGLTDGIGRATARVLLADRTSSLSVMSLATRRDLTTSVDWPDQVRGGPVEAWCTTRASGC